MTSVPTIDLGADAAAVTDAIGAACREVGFFQVTGHGVDPAIIQRAFRTARSFFDLPLADRMTAALVTGRRIRIHPDGARDPDAIDGDRRCHS